MDSEIAHKKKEIIRLCLANNILIPIETLSKINDIGLLHSRLKNNEIAPSQILHVLEEKEKLSGKSSVRIITSHKDVPKKRTVQDFVSYFKQRYKSIESLLKQRDELRSIVSIRRVEHKPDNDTANVIGLVYSKDVTKNGNIILLMEDTTGMIKAIINKNNEDLFRQAQDIVCDEVIGLIGRTRNLSSTYSKKNMFIFAEEIIFPDIPLSSPKKSYDEAYAAVLTDIEFGSKIFMEEEFNNFILWIRGEKGSEKHRRMASLTKYIFIVGDLVSGVGIYPGQENELAVQDIYQQYDIAADALGRIPPDKHIILCPGNHDASRIAEPQPELINNFTKVLKKIPNIVFTSNPSMVRIHESNNFEGFDVLLYHGFSYSYYADNVPSIRESGLSISDRTELVMKYLLQKRHLAPAYKSNLFIPYEDKDPLVIDNVPDIFLSGHIHKFRTTTYRNTIIICGSCWSPKTEFQEKMGHTPEPCKVPLIHLHDRKLTVLDFQK